MTGTDALNSPSREKNPETAERFFIGMMRYSPASRADEIIQSRPPRTFCVKELLNKAA